MKELKAKIEAVLLCTPDGIDSNKLAKICGIGSAGHIKSIVEALAKEYQDRGSGLEIVRVGNSWKLRVCSQHADLVKEAAKPELNSATLETLAFIAWKGSCTQASVIKARSTKAYNHLIELEEQGFIQKKKSRGTFSISPTKKFFEYFDLNDGEKLNLPQ